MYCGGGFSRGIVLSPDLKQIDAQNRKYYQADYPCDAVQDIPAMAVQPVNQKFHPDVVLAERREWHT